MSEKRFIVIEEGVEREDTVIEDTITKERYNEYGVVDLLNEQQEIIKKQDERIKELESILADDIVRKSEIKEAWKQRTEKRGI